MVNLRDQWSKDAFPPTSRIFSDDRPHRSIPVSLDAKVASLAEDVKTCIELLQTQMTSHQSAFQIQAGSINSLLATAQAGTRAAQQTQDRVSAIEDRCRQLGNVLEAVSATMSMLKQHARDQSEVKNRHLKEKIDAQRREIESLHALLDGRPPQFPQFQHLPPEVRAIIWNYALPRKVLKIEESHQLVEEDVEAPFHQPWQPQYRFAPQQSPPAIAQVCKESRAIACRAGKIIPIRNALAGLGPAHLESISRQGFPSSTKPRFSWFDPDRDTLYLKISLQPGSAEILRELLTVAQSIMLDTPDEHLLELLSDWTRCPMLTEVCLVGQSIRLPARSDPYVESCLFGAERINPIVIDLDDTPAIDSLIRKLERGRHSFVRSSRGLSELRDGGGLAWTIWDNDTKQRRNVDWPECKRHLLSTWKRKPSPGDDAMEGIDSDVQNMLKRQPELNLDIASQVPTFRRICLVELVKWDSGYCNIALGLSNHDVLMP